MLASVAAFTALLAPQAPPGAITAITGRVVDQLGQPVPLADVRIEARDSDRPLATTTADGSGWFRTTGLAGIGLLRVRASADGMCTGWGWAREPESFVTINLREATTVRGTLLGPDGEPLAATNVVLRTHSEILAAPPIETTTDADGRFALHGAPLGFAWITAWHEREGVAAAFHRVIDDDELTLRIAERAPNTLQVEIERLPGDLLPVRIAVEAYPEGRLVGLPTANCRDLPWSASLPSWRFVLEPEIEGYVCAPRRLSIKLDQGPMVARFVAHPRPDARYRCPAVAVDADGQPVADVPFLLYPKLGPPGTTATSDAGGRLEFVSSVGRNAPVSIRVADGGWSLDPASTDRGPNTRRRQERLEVRLDASTPIDLRVVRACHVRGRILTAEGRPAAHVPVQLEHPFGLPDHWIGFAFTHTDARGEFSIDGLPYDGGETRIAVRAEAGSVEGEPFRIASPGAEHADDLTLRPPATIEGRVVDRQGRPAPGVTIQLGTWNEVTQQLHSVVREVATDRQGRFRIAGAPEGTVFLALVTGPDLNDTERIGETFEVEPGGSYPFEVVWKH